MRTSIDTQYHYHEWHEIFRADSSDRPRLVEIWETSVRATHHFLREEDIPFFLPSANSGFLSTLEVYGIRNREYTIMGFIGIAVSARRTTCLISEYYS